MSNLGLR
jgi:hypothetical protein